MLSRFNLKSEFVKYILVLMTGTVSAQIAGYLFAPIISRIYTPEEAAELGVFIRVVNIGAAFATLRYELAVPIAKTTAHSFRLYKVALLNSIGVTLLVFIAILIPISFSLGNNSAAFYIMIPIALFFSAATNIGTNWAIRNKFFNTISYSRISNSVVAGVSKVGLGWLNFGSIGLIIGMVIGLVVSNILFIRDYFRAQSKYNVPIRSSRNFLLAKEYSEFPKINLPHVLMDLTRDLLMALLIFKLFSKEDFGLYDLSFRMLRLPLIFIGVAIGQVLFQKIAESKNEGKDIVPMLRKAIFTLFLLSIIPFTIIFLFGEDLFAFVFGEEWRGSGRYSEILTPWFMFLFISSPISSIPLILRKQREFFKLAILGSVMMISGIFVPGYFLKYNIEDTLLILSISQAIYIVFVIFKIYSYAKNTD